MKQAELLKLVAKAARTNRVTWGFVRHGGKHDIYQYNGIPFRVPDYAVTQFSVTA